MQPSFFRLSRLVASNRAVARFAFALLFHRIPYLLFLLFVSPFFFPRRATPRMIHRDGTPLPLVFRSSLNKQAPIKVPGLHSTSGSRDHQSRRICEALWLSLVPFASPFRSLSRRSLPVSLLLSLSRVVAVSRSDLSYLYPPTAKALKTICHRQRKYAAAYETCIRLALSLARDSRIILVVRRGRVKCEFFKRSRDS